MYTCHDIVLKICSILFRSFIVSGGEGKAEGSPGKGSDQSDDRSTASPLAQVFNTGVSVATTQASDSFLQSSFQ